MIRLILLFAGAYVAGSVNFSILLFKVLKKNDPRNGFSKNPGAFNVYRQLGFLWALVVLVLDVARSMGVAFVAVVLLGADLIPWVGLGLILGNRFPCFHNFRGGKGVANYLGFSAFLVPLYALAAILAWVTAYMVMRVAFIGSFLMVFILGMGTLITYHFDPPAGAGVLATVGLIYYSHKANVIMFLKEKSLSGQK